MRKFQDDEEEDPNDSSSMLQDSLDAGASADDPNVDDPNVDEPDSTPDDTESPVPSRQSSRFADIFNQAQALPEGKANARYREFLDQGMPPEQKPGKLNRLAAILGGVSEGYFHGASKGFDTQDKILNAPHDREIKDFANKATVLNAAAGQEDKVDQNRNRFARTAIASLKDEDTATNNAARIKAQTEHWNAADQNAAATAKTKGFMHVVGTDGNLYFEKPNADGTITKLNGGKVGEAIPEKTKRLIETFKVEEGIRQNNRLNLEGTRHTNRLGEEDNTAVNTRINQNINRGTQMVADAANKDAIAKREDAKPAAQHAARLNRLQEAITNPANLEQAKKLGIDLNNFLEVKKDAQGNRTVVGIKNPTSGDHQKNKQVYDVLWNHMFGGDEEQ